MSFTALNEMRTDDLGRTWSGPVEHAGNHLGGGREAGGIEVVICDANPKWHAVTGTLLSTGHTARYLGDGLMPDPRPREIAYAVYDARCPAVGAVGYDEDAGGGTILQRRCG